MRYQPESLVLPGKNHGTEKSDGYEQTRPVQPTRQASRIAQGLVATLERLDGAKTSYLSNRSAILRFCPVQWPWLRNGTVRDKT